jgi:fatty-acyl-CoA synthase
VVGLPDERWGEAPHAFVVLAPGASASEEELRQFAHDNLAHFKVPHSVKSVDELPMTATGKIQKYVLRGGNAAVVRQYERPVQRGLSLPPGLSGRTTRHT